MRSNHLNIVLPAVQAKGLPKPPSLSPGAWPISKIGDSTGLPLTTGPIIAGHLLQFDKAARWSRMSCSRIDISLKINLDTNRTMIRSGNVRQYKGLFDFADQRFAGQHVIDPPTDVSC